MKKLFTVHYNSAKNCFLHFPELWLKEFIEVNINNIHILKVEYGDNKCAYFSPSPQANGLNDEDIVCLNATYAHSLGINNEEVVVISLISSGASVQSINVSPISIDDLEILEENSNVVQSSLLNQVRVVWPGQELVIWVYKSVHLCIQVSSLEPSYPVGKLEPFTEVVVGLPNTKQPRYVNREEHSKQRVLPSEEEVSASNKEVVDLINVPPTLQAADNLQPKPSLLFSVWNSMSNILSRGNAKENNNVERKSRIERDEMVAAFKLCKHKSKAVSYRVHPLQVPEMDDISNFNDLLFYYPYNVFVHRRNALATNSSTNMLICKLTIIPFPLVSPSDPQSKAALKFAEINESSVNKLFHDKREKLTCAYVRVFIIEDVLVTLSSDLQCHIHEAANYFGHQCILVSDILRKVLNLDVGAKVNLEEISLEPDKMLTEIDFYPLKGWHEDSSFIERVFKKYLQDHIKASSVLISSDSVIPLTKTRVALVVIKPPDLNYALIDSVNCEKIKITVKDIDVTLIHKFGQICNRENLKHINMQYGGMESEVNEGSISLEICLGLQASSLRLNKTALTTYNILILGKMGSGKSTLAKTIFQTVEKCPYFVHCLHVQCKQYKGKKVEALQKLFSQWLVECVYYQPAILVLDDLDALVGAGSMDHEVSAESLYFTRVGERLLELLEDFQARHYISVIATAVSLASLNPTLVSPRGQHLFKTILKVPELNKDSRLIILKNIISQKPELSMNNDSSLDLSGFARRTDGFLVQDLTDLVNKAVYHSWKSTLSGGNTELIHLTLRDVDMEQALKNSVPLSLYGVDLYQSSSKSWADIGGLVHVKKVLVEVLQWPSQYPGLFENSPLRHQSGLLLYGAPGTGKTLLAGAVAHECGLKFISVKGPELLSKYIGASEEAVRNIFQRAQSARPCVLFFDEFDSLAPRRGHDSTGVTDRVVNQLLTQLDGVESLQGVWVMAATSRPDMLDPALLRPGRLDKALLCPLPGTEERLSILQALGRKLSLSSEVNLQALVGPTRDFTGADLQAVLYTAQLRAVEKKFTDSDHLMLNVTHDNLPYNVDNPGSLSEVARIADNRGPTSSTSVVASVEITQGHLMAALKETRPSLSLQDKLRYEYIYAQFANSRSGDAAKEVASSPQRATLA